MHVSTDFEPGGDLPLAHTKDGDNVSPPVAWSDLPSGTQEIAVLFENVTPSTREPYVQWLAYGIDPAEDGLARDVGHAADPDAVGSAVHGRNDLGNLGYDGPVGSVGTMVRLRLRVVALSRPSEAEPGLDARAFFERVADAVAGEAEVPVTFERPR